MINEYSKRAAVTLDLTELEKYKDKVKVTDENNRAHWGQVSKRVMTLFQVLMDGNLIDLVDVLKRYPEYTELVCEHFRYSYGYSEQHADIGASSEMLSLSEEFHNSKKQFVRNLLRKMPGVSDLDFDEIKTFADELAAYQENMHPIVSDFYAKEIRFRMETLGIHKLQKMAIKKKTNFLVENEIYDFTAADKDSHMDIPYMN